MLSFAIIDKACAFQISQTKHSTLQTMLDKANFVDTYLQISTCFNRCLHKY